MPLPARDPLEVLHRLAGSSHRSALDALSGIEGEATELEGFRPLSASLEWRLADAYWAAAGVMPFTRNDVPYLVNNTGRLSESAAALALTALGEGRVGLPDRVIALELGAGSGLFARYFLDALLAHCRSEGSDLYDRLLYVVSDRFERTVRHWGDVGLFAGHEAHVVCRVLDAPVEHDLQLTEGAPALVFCNYLLDVLPSAIARRTEDGLEQLCVRTHLAGGAGALQTAGLASLEEARALAASDRPEALERLLPLLPRLELETAYRAWHPASHAEQALAAKIAIGERATINFGALACLRRLLDRVHESGFVLINDYGPVRSEDAQGHIGVQRFGGSVAMGLHFGLLERALGEDGYAPLVPEGDSERRVRTRYFARQVGPRTREAFHACFRLNADRYLDEPQEQAREHVAAGRRDEAVAAYRTLIERNPLDWQLLGEAAEYVGLQLRDHAAGLEVVRAALQRNPWSSCWLWNVLGDCLYYAGKLEDAHQAFLQAQAIDGDDPRTNLNLAYTLAARGENAAALSALARGLAHDARGLYRPRLLEKQAQVLATLSEQASAEQQRLQRRAERFR
jgi:tetratricopeptide (TPR) repeat protein